MISFQEMARLGSEVKVVIGELQGKEQLLGFQKPTFIVNVKVITGIHHGTWTNGINVTPLPLFIESLFQRTL